MKRAPLILPWVGIAVAAMMVFAACDDEPTQAEANEAFCDAVGNYAATLRDVEDLDSDSSLDEVQDAADQANGAYEAMLEASAGVVDVRLDDVEDARSDLQAAIDDVSEGASFGEALDSVDDEITNVIAQVSQVLNDVVCGLEGTGPSSDSASDE